MVEKRQVQALVRTQPTSPLLPGRPAIGTHDDTRDGTTSLFAALNMATGQAIGECHRRYQHQEFLASLDHLDSTVARPPGTAICVVIGNCGTHKHPAVRAWFVRRSVFVPHVSPTK